jgi:hypothetical protein
MMTSVNDPLPTDLPAVRFADAARRLGAATHAIGLTVPAFRCPPRVAGANRTIRRYPGGAVVSVRLRGRQFEAAMADMIDGVLATNQVPASDVPRLRASLAAFVEAGAVEPAMEATPEPAARAA